MVVSLTWPGNIRVSLMYHVKKELALLVGWDMMMMTMEKREV